MAGNGQMFTSGGRESRHPDPWRESGADWQTEANSFTLLPAHELLRCTPPGRTGGLTIGTSFSAEA